MAKKREVGRPRSRLSQFDKETAVALAVAKEEQDRNRMDINAIIQILKEQEELMKKLAMKIKEINKITPNN